MTRSFAWFLAFGFTTLGCRIPNQDHCGRQRGDQTCAALDPSRPYCDRCEPDHDGCVESLAEIAAECRLDGAEVSDETTGSETDGGDESETSDTSDTGSTETGFEPECGNGIKEAGEDCDGTDFDDSTCADPYGLPNGTLTCVPGECLIVTSECCLPDGEVCEPGECCNANCNLVTNKCGGV